jgi:hypothetical protein
MIYEKISFNNLRSLIKKNDELKEILSNYSDTTLSPDLKLSIETELASCDLAIKQEVELIKVSLNLTPEQSLPLINEDCDNKRTELFGILDAFIYNTRSSTADDYDLIISRLETLQKDFTLITDGIEELGHVRAIREFLILTQYRDIVLFPQI